MSWDLGVVRGTASGLARESAWKQRDRVNMMNQESTQLEQLINQIGRNKEYAYRKDRDAVRDEQWRKGHELDKNQDRRAQAASVRDRERHDIYKEQSEYEISRRGVREKQADDIHRARMEAEKDRNEAHDSLMETERIRREGIKREDEFNYGKENPWAKTWVGKMFPDIFRRKEGYKDILRDDASMKRDTTREQREWMNSEEGRAYIKSQRELESDKTKSEIELNKARSHAYRNPQRTGTSPKGLTWEQSRSAGRTNPVVKTMLKRMKEHKRWYLPGFLESKLGREEISGFISEAGKYAGEDLARRIPAGVSESEINDIIMNQWQGILEQEGFLDIILGGEGSENFAAYENSARLNYFNAARKALGLKPTSVGGADELYNMIEDTLKNTEENTDIDTSFWGKVRDVREAGRRNQSYEMPKSYSPERTNISEIWKGIKSNEPARDQGAEDYYRQFVPTR